MADVPKRYFERFFILAGFIFVVLLLLGAFWLQNNKKLGSVEVSMAAKFKKFKTYTGEYNYLPSINVLDPNGDFVGIRKFGGKYTVLNIWSTSCKPCAKQLLSMQRLSQMIPYESGWRVMAVSIDSRSALPRVAKFTQYYGIEDIANYHDYNMELQNNIELGRLPVTLVISKSGRILYKMQGAALWHDRGIVEFLDLVRKVY